MNKITRGNNRRAVQAIFFVLLFVGGLATAELTHGACPLRGAVTEQK